MDISVKTAPISVHSATNLVTFSLSIGCRVDRIRAFLAPLINLSTVRELKNPLFHWKEPCLRLRCGQISRERKKVTDETAIRTRINETKFVISASKETRPGQSRTDRRICHLGNAILIRLVYNSIC